jgi:hypothetical protein
MKGWTTFAAGLTAGILIAISATLAAGQVSGLISFTAGSPARAADVNSNFSQIASAVNNNDQRIAALEALLAGVTRTTLNGKPAIQFSGVNVQIVNGAGSTASANGTGNLIVGYDEPDASGISRCTLGSNPGTQAPVASPADCIAAGGTQTAAGFKTGSHYLVIGTQNNYSRWGGAVIGANNTSSFDWASVLGGQLNSATGSASSVSGGINNTANGPSTSVSGGAGNVAGGSATSVSGGNGNSTFGVAASVSGGIQNVASGSGSSISGGTLNATTAQTSSVSGGTSNTASGLTSAVSGGASNKASGPNSAVSGGSSNEASGDSSSVSGGFFNGAQSVNSSVSGGGNNFASGGVSSVSGGFNNGATNDFGSVSGGFQCTLTVAEGWAVGTSTPSGCSATIKNF